MKNSDPSNNIVSNNRNILSERIREVIEDMLGQDERPRENYSVFISHRLGLNYTYLANLFSEVNRLTIEHYIIEKRIRKAADLLSTGKYTVGEMAVFMNYSSIGHFSNQFKKVMGISPNRFRRTSITANPV